MHSARHLLDRHARYVLMLLMLLWSGSPLNAQNNNLPAGVRSVVFHNAPFFIEETAQWNDQIRPVDYDGDLMAYNNGPYLTGCCTLVMPNMVPAIPKVYYSVVETSYGPDDGYYLIGYYHYHPEDTGFLLSATHSNDMEGVWLVVQKSSLLPYGRPVLALTEAHGALIPYWSDTNVQDYNAAPQPAGGFQGRLHSWLDLRYQHDRVVFGIAGSTHGTYAAQDCSGHTVPNIANFPTQVPLQGPGGVGMWRNSVQDFGTLRACIRTDKFNAIFYEPQTLESISPYSSDPRPTALPNTQLSGLALYGLEHISESVMWQYRGTSGFLFSGQLVGLLGGFTALEFFSDPNGKFEANPPWAWYGGRGECVLGTCYYDWINDGTTSGYSPKGWATTGAGALLGGSGSELHSRFSFLPNANQPDRFNPYVTNPPDYNTPPVPPFTASISGPPAVITGRSGTWGSTVSGGVAPYTRQWSGLFSGTGISVTGRPTQSGYLYLDVWDSSGRHATDAFWIDANM
jgi:hypothetical protein